MTQNITQPQNTNFVKPNNLQIITQPIGNINKITKLPTYIKKNIEGKDEEILIRNMDNMHLLKATSTHLKNLDFLTTINLDLYTKTAIWQEDVRKNLKEIEKLLAKNKELETKIQFGKDYIQSKEKDIDNTKTIIKNLKYEIKTRNLSYTPNKYRSEETVEEYNEL